MHFVQELYLFTILNLKLKKKKMFFNCVHALISNLNYKNILILKKIEFGHFRVLNPLNYIGVILSLESCQVAIRIKLLKKKTLNSLTRTIR